MIRFSLIRNVALIFEVFELLGSLSCCSSARWSRSLVRVGRGRETGRGLRALKKETFALFHYYRARFVFFVFDVCFKACDWRNSFPSHLVMLREFNQTQPKHLRLVPLAHKHNHKAWFSLATQAQAQTWRRHKHKRKHKHMDQNYSFFLCLRLCLRWRWNKWKRNNVQA